MIPSTINFHINYQCNAHCLYCFRPGGQELSHENRCRIIRLLAAAPPAAKRGRRINFAGGEPTLVAELADLLRVAKESGLQTSVITNGKSLVRTGIKHYLPWIDMIGISIDSLSDQTNRTLGRPAIAQEQWLQLADQIRLAGVALKINTVVSRFNCHEDLSAFIGTIQPARWKIMRAIEIEGVNETSAHQWRITDVSFRSFIDRHQCLGTAGITCIIEDDHDLRGSYAMISPDGRFYDSVSGGYKTSKPILSVGVLSAFREIRFSNSKFIARGGQHALATEGSI